MPRNEILQGGRQHCPGEGGHQPDAQIAADLACEAARSLMGMLEAAEGFDEILVITQPRRRRHDAARGALKQLDAERALDRGDVLRNAGLRRVLALGGARERTLLTGSDDGANLAQRDVGHAVSITKTDTQKQNILFW